MATWNSATRFATHTASLNVRITSDFSIHKMHAVGVPAKKHHWKKKSNMRHW